MKSINAYLCPGCIQILRPWFQTEPAENAGERKTCSWCERVETDSVYRIRITKERPE